MSDNTYTRLTPVKSIFNFPFSTIMLFKCMSQKKYALGFQNGGIFLNHPANWVKLEQDGNKGQGDLLEGTFFTAKITDTSPFITQLKGDPSIETVEQQEYIFFRRKDALQTFCSCFYGLKDDCFKKNIAEDGKAHYTFHVPQNYFFDFSECKTQEEYDQIVDEEKPCVVLINNPHELFERVKKALYALNVNETDIIISPVEYLDKHSRMLSIVEYPKELLIKDSFFSDQSEVRIIVNNRSPEFLQYMQENSNVLQVGSLEDICEVYDYYFSDMIIEKKGNRSLMFSLPSSRNVQIEDLNYFELEDLLFNVLLGNVTLTNVPQHIVTWQQKLQPIIDVMEKKFNVRVFVDENKHVSIMNMSNELLEQSATRNKVGRAQQTFAKEIEGMIANGQLDLAKQRCMESIDIAHLKGIAHFYAARISLLQGMLDDAVNHFQMAKTFDYMPVESTDGIASIYLQQKNYELAIETYKEIQDMIGYNHLIWVNMGIVYIHWQHYSDAIECFDKAIAIKPDDAAAYYNKGIALHKIGCHTESKKYIEEALKLDPSNCFYQENYKKVSLDSFATWQCALSR